MPLDNGFDIAGNIRAVEIFKSRLLTGVADLFESVSPGGDPDRAEDALSDIITTAYMLGGRMGLSPKSLDLKAKSHIRVKLSQPDRGLRDDLKDVFRHLDRKQKEDEYEGNTSSGY